MASAARTWRRARATSWTGDRIAAPIQLMIACSPRASVHDPQIVGEDAPPVLRIDSTHDCGGGCRDARCAESVWFPGVTARLKRGRCSPW